MNRKTFAGALLCASLLAGCNSTTGQIPSIMGAANGLAAADNALARLAGNDIPAACGIIAVAEGYFHALKPKISAKNQAIEAKAEAAVNSICANPPTNVAGAMVSLFGAWSAIQSATSAD